MSPIGAIRLPTHIGSIAGASPTATPAAAASFESVMTDAVRTVDSIQKASQSTVERFLSGEGEELHTVALEQQRAAIAFDVFLQVRNKVVQAYQDVMRMPI